VTQQVLKNLLCLAKTRINRKWLQEEIAQFGVRRGYSENETVIPASGGHISQPALSVPDRRKFLLRAVRCSAVKMTV